ncbi:phosphatase [Rhizobium leguminosarum]|uniref:metallophosphoesterase n=1 Tax=Rhizobium leguminosarum TaxID=384 RepID=UPI001C910E32|nr:metallophosphoesterase [Rhizobium leguminosarum]MBY3176545.1 phosphatase [Rhizobium leguminosarum]
MNIWTFSDLHLEFGDPFNTDPPKDVDVVVCAGDVLTRGITPSIKWLTKNVARTVPVVFVAGNHEFYNSSINESMREVERGSGFQNLHFLENDAVEIGGVVFVGGTLWSDFRLFGRDPEVAMSYARSGMNDYKKIKLSKVPFQKFKPIDAYRKHVETRDFIAAELRRRAGQKTVVVTHHAPSPRSVAGGFRHDPLSACYASDLEDLICETGPTLWVHGHIHRRNDYMIDSTRIVSNPRGYPGEATGFDPVFTVDV